MTSSWKRQKEFSKAEIVQRLEGFEHVQDIKNLKTGMHVRYLSTDKNTKNRSCSK